MLGVRNKVDMRRATAEASANLAFVKYWGKKDRNLNLPMNGSISVNLSEARTITSVEFVKEIENDQVFMDGKVETATAFAEKISKHLDIIRSIYRIQSKAIIKTHNTFPSSIGIASSASGFAALTLAATAALDINLTQKELSILARLGSGSAARSVPSGFVEWLEGIDNDSSYAVEIAPPEYWDISIVTVVVSAKPKKITSTDGHDLAKSSEFYEQRIKNMPLRLNAVRQAILDKDFTSFGRQVEMEAISLHVMAMTSPVISDGWYSGVFYWVPDTLELIHNVQIWRKEGVEVYFTLDAGPTVHIVTKTETVPLLLDAIRRLEGAHAKPEAWTIIVNKPSHGARLLE